MPVQIARRTPGPRPLAELAGYAGDGPVRRAHELAGDLEGLRVAHLTPPGEHRTRALVALLRDVGVDAEHHVVTLAPDDDHVHPIHLDPPAEIVFVHEIFANVADAGAGDGARWLSRTILDAAPEPRYDGHVDDHPPGVDPVVALPADLGAVARAQGVDTDRPLVVWLRRPPETPGDDLQHLVLDDVPPPARPALTRLARVVVLPPPAVGREPAVGEAMWLGRPVVAPQAPGPRAQIDHGVNGLLAADADDVREHVDALLNAPGFAVACGRAARERVRTGGLLPHALIRELELYLELR